MDKKRVSQEITHYCYLDSPLGALLLAGCSHGLRLISFPDGSRTRQPMPEWQKDTAKFGLAKEQLSAYFSGEIKVFTAPIILQGTSFQKQVWAALQTIPFGQTAAYGDIANIIGNPGAARAVGGANNANPIPIIIPCHRIIGSDQSLTGFGGGLVAKQTLLAHEAKFAKNVQIELPLGAN